MSRCKDCRRPVLTAQYQRCVACRVIWRKLKRLGAA